MSGSDNNRKVGSEDILVEDLTIPELTSRKEFYLKQIEIVEDKISCINATLENECEVNDKLKLYEQQKKEQDQLLQLTKKLSQIQFDLSQFEISQLQLQSDLQSTKSGLYYKLQKVLDNSFVHVLNEINKCNFDQIPEDFLEGYASTKSGNWKSPDFVNNVSFSTNIPNERDQINLSNLNFGWLSANKSTLRIDVLSNINELENMLCQHIFNGSTDTFNDFVTTEIKRLTAVRTLIYNKFTHDSAKIDELAYVQPLVTKMEADFIERIQNHKDYSCQSFKIRAAQKDILNANAFVYVSSTETREMKLSGYSDIFIYEQSGEDEVVVRLQELKASCKEHCLYHSNPSPWKSQLCGQIYCLGDMHENLELIFGGLLDLFVICVVIRVKKIGGEHQSDESIKYLISDRITDPRSYIILLILNLFGLPKDKIDELYLAPTTTSSVSYFEKDEYLENILDEGTNLSQKFASSLVIEKKLSEKELEGKKTKSKKFTENPPNNLHFFRDEDHDKDKNSGGEMPRRSKRIEAKSINLKQGKTSFTTENKHPKQSRNIYSHFVSYAYMESQSEKVKDLLEWDTKRLGFAPLTASELNKRSATFSKSISDLKF